MINELKTILHSHFKLKDLGDLKYFLGVEISRSDQDIVMNQRKYAMELISELGLSGAKPVCTPFEQNLKLTTKEYDDLIEKQTEGKAKSKDKLMKDPRKFKRLVGRLLYLTITRPDICYSVNHISQFMHQPKESHYQATIRIVRYIKGEPGKGLLMKRENSLILQAYCDSDWASCILNRRSTTGYCIRFEDSTISWKSRKQRVVSRSSAEAEHRAMAETISELAWVKGIIGELGVATSEPTELFCNSEAAIHIATNPVYHERTKHIEVDCHLIREQIQEKLIKTTHIPSLEQTTYIFT
ncbi:uncharacterized mitochondrial protein AtMg00810-like [Rutidosis leptorrhynchoides]|uniref:uncharacterized mitochondrial protein AtMg00810-like n=1 Tax=Rutidosis leptorrhynchoides TaxID=125765 RepID=UPI003A99BD69